MIFNIKPLIAKALLSSQAVLDFVAKDPDNHPVIGSNKLVAGLFPAIEFHQVGGSDAQSTDDEITVREYRFQVTIFTKDSSHYKVENELDELIRSLGFHCYFDHEMYEESVDVTHRVFLYQVRLDRDRFIALNNKYPLTPEEEAILNAL